MHSHLFSYVAQFMTYQVVAFVVKMANPKHVAVVKKGAAAVREWRKEHPKEILNLYQANLSQANLVGADLSDAFLYGANLSGANLSKANLSGADLNDVDLSGANLSEANLFKADLHGANLQKADLSRADLAMATLYQADLSAADLSNAELPWVNLHLANMSEACLFEAEISLSRLTRSNLSGANLSGADLFDANLFQADLSNADFSGANLTLATLSPGKLLETNLSNTDLTEARLLGIDASNINLTNSTMNRTRFGSCNLARSVGLDTIQHEGPSSIDFETLVISFRKSGNCLTSELETFFLNCGIPRELLEALPTILAEVKYSTCFVCYGQPDLALAERLKKDLKSRGVSAWLYSLDATPGKRTWKEITLKRREAEKMIVLCSAKALIRNGVLKEIEEQKDEDPDKIVPISLDNTWKESGFPVKRGQQELKTYLLDRNYADFSDESKYEDSLERLLKGIKREGK